MSTKRLIADAFLVLGMIVLAWVAWSQQQEIRRLSEQTGKLEGRLGESEVSARPPAATKKPEIALLDDAPPKVERLEPVERIAGTNPRPRVARIKPVEEPAQEFDVDDPEVRLKLRDMIQQEREYQREQRWARRQEHHEERVRERLQEIAQANGLDEVTTQRVEDMLVVEIAEVTDLFREARKDGEWHGLRDKIGEVREETDARARELLDSDQFAEYEEMRDQDFRGFGGRRRDRDEDDDNEDR